MRNKNNMISIIISVYNGERFLQACLDSVLHQDYANLEIIIVNDGSKDDSAHIIDEYAVKDKRMVVIHQENSGVSKSRNKALSIARGEYICIIDQDDVLSKDYVSYFYSLIAKYGVEIAITPGVDKFFDKPHVETERQITSDRVTVLSGEQTAIEMLYHKIVIAPWNKIISKDLIVRNDIKFHPDFFNGEGFAFSLECFQRARKVAVGHRKVYHYRVGDPESGASKFKESIIHSSINAQQYIKDSFVKSTSELLKAWFFSNWHTHCDALNIMIGCNVTTRHKELYNKIQAVCQRDALCALSAPVSFQQKVRGILYKTNPRFAATIINYFRLRKFTKEEA